MGLNMSNSMVCFLGVETESHGQCTGNQHSCNNSSNSIWLPNTGIYLKLQSSCVPHGYEGQLSDHFAMAISKSGGHS